MHAPVLIVAAPRAGSALLSEALGVTVADPYDVPSAARLIYLYRDPRASIIAACTSGPSPVIIDRQVIDRAVDAWETCTRHILELLASRADAAWTATTYEALTTTPRLELCRLAEFAGVYEARLPRVMHTTMPPDSDVWRPHELAILPRMSALAGTNNRAKLLCATAMVSPPMRVAHRAALDAAN